MLMLITERNEQLFLDFGGESTRLLTCSLTCTKGDSCGQTCEGPFPG